MSMADWITYANQGATRNQPVSNDLVKALSYLPEMGLEMEVFSGGQPAAGGGPRVGSTRHDHGGAADVFFRKDGQRLDWANPQHQPIFQEIVRRGRANGLTGFGAGDGYMQPGSMHVGFGKPAVWGANGKGSNAPAWLTEAFGGAPAPTPNGNALSFGGAVPAGAPGLASMFDPRLAQAGLSMGTPFGAPQSQRTNVAQREDAETRRAEQDRRLSLADLIRY